MMPASSSTYVQHALWNYPSHALREQKTKLLTARGPGSTVCTASLRKSAEPAYWPRRVPALGQPCTRAGEWSAGLLCMTRTMNTRTCPNIRDLILKCTKTHESAQLRAGDPDMRHHAGDILALETRGRESYSNNQINAAQKSKNQIPLVIPPYHTTPKKNQNNQNTGSIPGNVPHWRDRELPKPTMDQRPHQGDPISNSITKLPAVRHP